MKRIIISCILVLAMVANLFLATSCSLISDVVGEIKDGIGGIIDNITGGNGDTDDGSKAMGDVILLVDLSDNMASKKSEIDSFVESVVHANNGARLGIVTFGYDCVYAAQLTNSIDDLLVNYYNADEPDTGATNIAGAIEYAVTLLDTSNRSKIVVISDGAETDGNALEAAKAAADKGIIVDTVYFEGSEADNEAQIVSMELPDERIVVGEEFMVKVNLMSSYSGRARITPYDNSAVGTTSGVAVEIELVRGPQTVEIPFSFAIPGLHEIRVELSSEGDSSSLNNTYTSYLNIQTFDKILLIESIDNESESLRNMLDETLNVDVVNVADPINMPSTVNEIREYDQVILVNVSYADMPQGFDEMLYSYVYEFGGGLFTVCGNKEDSNPSDDEWTANAYTREDMFGTLYQKLLPVEIINYTPPVAVVIIIDNSGSMCPGGAYEESPLYYAKQGAYACLDALTERDFVGVMPLDFYSSGIDLIPRPNRNKILSAIEGIDVCGATEWYPAFEQAGRVLGAKTGVEKKHIILITDGEAADRDSVDLKEQLLENAARGITLSVVGVNCNSTAAREMKDLLKNYAGMSENNFYNANDVYMLPEIMRNDLEVPEIKDVNYFTFQPTFGAKSAITAKLNEDDMPTLDGFYGVKAKEGAEVIIMGAYTPIYTQWKCGKGTVGTFACDLNGTWSSDLISSPIGTALINNIVQAIFPTQSVRPEKIGYIMNSTVDTDNRLVKVNVDTYLQDGEYLELTVTKVLGGFSCFHETKSSSNEPFLFSLDEAGVYSILLEKRDADGVIVDSSETYTAFSYSKEYDAFYDRELAAELLEQIAYNGNGRLISHPNEVFDFDLHSDNGGTANEGNNNAENIAILDLRVVTVENRYTVEIDVVSYGRDVMASVSCTVNGTALATPDNPSPTPYSFTLSDSVILTNEEVATVTFGAQYPDLFNLESYSSVSATVSGSTNDSNPEDNTATVEYKNIRMLYSGYTSGTFFDAFMYAYREQMHSFASVEFDRFACSPQHTSEIPNSGYDVYIYESYLPDTLPTDGAVILVNPSSIPSAAGVSLGTVYDTADHDIDLTAKATNHPIMKGVDAESITVTRFTELKNADGYTTLMSVTTDELDIPVVMAKNEADQKIAIISFSLSYSNLALLADFPLIMSNIIDSFILSDNERENAVGGELDQPSYPPNSFMSDLVLNGATYYREVLEEYKDLLDYTLDQREGYLTDSQIALIRMYFNLL